MECNRFVIIGGGIAGVSCAETLLSYLPTCQVTIVSASSLVKAVRNVKEITRTLTSFEVQETPIDTFERDNPNIKVLHCEVSQIDHDNKIILTDKGDEIPYDKLCVCTGAQPKLVFPKSDYVLGIRDTATAEELDLKLKIAEKIVVVGNGGIAIELVFQVCDCEVVWVIKDKAIGQVFFDPGAAEFFLPFLDKSETEPDDTDQSLTIKRMNYQLSSDSSTFHRGTSTFCGNALGPDWHQKLNLTGKRANSLINVEYICEVKALHYFRNSALSNIDRKSNEKDWPLFVEMTNGKSLGCDFLVSATGVEPFVKIFDGLTCSIAADGGVNVDQNMKVQGLTDVYAAGDVCSTSSWPKSPHWHQMRLWTQARQMGAFAARCMAMHSQDTTQVPTDICFDLFAHVTKFFGKKVCLLGRYNAQDLKKDEIDLLLRTTLKKEYIKVVLMNGRMQGAVLIGETDLEETFENLILNETDLSFLGENLLDPNVDIADYFD